MFDAIAEMTKPKPSDAASLVNMSRQWELPSLEHHALPVITGYLDQPDFLCKAIDSFLKRSRRIGNDCAKEYCTKILEKAAQLQACPYPAGPKHDWHFKMLLRSGLRFEGALRPQLIRFFKRAVGPMQSAMMLFNYACTTSIWTATLWLRVLCDEILMPRIPKMRYHKTRPSLGQGTHTLTVNPDPDYSIVVPKDLQDFIRNLSSFDQEEPKRVLEALVKQMAKYSTMNRDDFKDVLSPRLYRVLCRTLDDDFRSEEEKSRRPSFPTARQTTEVDATRNRQTLAVRTRKGSGRGRARS
jgi:hypothetical protein